MKEVREDIDQVLAQHLATRKRLQDDLLDDQQESVTFDVHGANVADVLEARFQLLEAFRAKEETHEGTENEDPIRTLALKNADLWKARERERTRPAALAAGGGFSSVPDESGPLLPLFSRRTSRSRSSSSATSAIAATRVRARTRRCRRART